MKDIMTGIFLTLIFIGGGVVRLDCLKYPKLFMLIPKILFIYTLLRVALSINT